MVKSNDTAEVTEISAAAAAVRERIANMPRQSPVRYVELYNIIKTAAPHLIDDYFGPIASTLETVADGVKNPVFDARAKAEEKQLEIAIAALENTDVRTGYAGYSFDLDSFNEKTREKTPRTRKDPVKTTTDLLDKMSDEDKAALAEILKARGIV